MDRRTCCCRNHDHSILENDPAWRAIFLHLDVTRLRDIARDVAKYTPGGSCAHLIPQLNKAADQLEEVVKEMDRDRELPGPTMVGVAKATSCPGGSF